MKRIQPLGRSSFIALGLLFLIALPGTVQASPDEVGTTDGKNYGEWAIGWWQWMLSVPAAKNPQNAQGEVNCGVNQSGPVWYLAGGDVGRPAVRSCSVLRGTKLFFPVVNLLVYNQPGESLTVEEKRAQLDDFFGGGEADSLADAKSAGPRPCGLFATLGGKSIARFTAGARVQSPPFALDTGDGPFGFPAGLVDRAAVSDGHWVMLPELAPGEHVLRFGGRFCQAGSLEDHPDFGPVDVTYQLSVVGPPAKSDDDDSDDDDSDDDDSDDDDSDDDDSDDNGDDLSNVEIIESLYAAFAGGDLDTILAILDEDVIWIESEGIPYGGTFIGRDAVFEGVFGKIGEEWDHFTAIVDETFAAAGDRVIVRQRDGGTFKATGKSMEASAISIWSLNDGRVVQFLQVIDTQEVVRATLP